MLTTLAVENHRSLRHLVPPLARLTLVTGANGSGKSSLHRALRLLADASRNGAVAALEGGLLDLGMPIPGNTEFNLDPEFKREPRRIRLTDSMLTESASPEVLVLRERIRSWRFYDQFRTDANAPARASRIGTRTRSSTTTAPTSPPPCSPRGRRSCWCGAPETRGRRGGPREHPDTGQGPERDHPRRPGPPRRTVLALAETMNGRSMPACDGRV